MQDEEELVTEADLLQAFGNANFGDMDPRTVIRQGVLKCASGYYQGHTSRTICKDLGLISSDYEVTAKGKQYLWAAFATEISV